MPVEVPNRRRQVDELYALFRNRLHDCAAQVYAPLLAAGVVRAEEVDEEIARYHARKRIALQEAYSRYAEQWEAFYRVTSAPDAGFLSELGRWSGAFFRRYDGRELDVDFYLQAFRRMAAGSPAWLLLRRLFEERWRNRLSDREYNFQLAQIERLCGEYHRMARAAANALENAGRNGDAVAPRLEWLQTRQSPELRKRLKELTAILRRSPIVKELNARLGRRVPLAEKCFRALTDKHSVQSVRRSSQSDITGVSEGDNLHALLPLEYACMADPATYSLFLKRYTEKSLQMFDSESKIRERSKASPRRGNDVSAPALQGPFVVCVDSSGSMAGTYEDIAKALVLGIGLLSERTGRRCRVILFSDQVETIEFASLHEGLPLLSDFFCRSFHGGTDVQAALSEATASLCDDEQYASADLLLLSDFETETPGEADRLRLEVLKHRDVRVYAVAFGNRPNDFYLDCADKYWIYR